MGIIYFWNTPDTYGQLVQSKQFFVTILAFAIPIIDTTSVVINRIKKGKSPFVGGKDHTTHSFYFMGMSVQKIAILYAAIYSLFTSLPYFGFYMLLPLKTKINIHVKKGFK